MKRLFRFLFRHDFELDQDRVRFVGKELHTGLTCSRCGYKVDYPTFNQAEFTRVYRLRGCPK